MDKLKYVRLENEDGSYSDSIPLAIDSDYVDVNGNTLTEEINNKAAKVDVNHSISNLQSKISSLAEGSPLVASSIDDMTNTNRIYVNTTDGHWYWYNENMWSDGGVYQATAISEFDPLIIKKLDKNMFENYLLWNNISSYKTNNMYNYETTENNARLRSSGSQIGKTYTAEGRWVSDYISVEPGDVLYASVNGLGTTFNGYCTYDSQKRCIEYKTYFYGPNQGNTIGENVAFIRVECANTIVPYNGKVQIEKNNVTPYLPYGIWFNKVNNLKEVIIKPSGGDYSSIRSAFETEGENTIYKIYPGVYKVDDDFTDEEILSASYSSDGSGFVGLVVPNGSKLIGIGDKKDIIIKTEISTSYSQSARYSIATLNLKGNCEIENLTILAMNTRTPIHDDYTASVDKIHIIKNCILRNETQVRSYSHGYGLGIRSGETVIVENCDIFPTMICHSNVAFTKEAYLEIKNTNIASNLTLQDSNSTKNVYCNLDNCNIGLIYYVRDNNTNDYMIINNLSYNKIPILLKDNNLQINGYNINENTANSNVLSNHLIKYVVDSNSIIKVASSNDINDSVGISLNSGNTGEKIKFMKFDKYLTTSIIGLQEFSLGDEIVVNNDGSFAIGTTNSIGKIIFIYNNIGIIKLY